MIDVPEESERSGLEGNLVVASNRLPVVLDRTDEGWRVEPGSGGLVTAMSPVLAQEGGRWVGWPGTVEASEDELREPLARAGRRAGYDFVPVALTEEERDNYYYGFANEVLWPLLHDLQTKYRFDPDFWDAYRRVNRKFAAVLARTAGPGDYVWVHDYHLMGVAEALRERELPNRLGYFLHTPFPSVDILVKLPWRAEILRALLHYDLVGFQTLRDRGNFLECVKAFAPEASVEGSGPVVACRWNERSIRVGAFPISIDYRAFADEATSPEVMRAMETIRRDLTADSVILGVDRLDYTKGIPNELAAFRTALENYPELRGDVSLVQVLVPSREHIHEYHELRTEVERLVGEVNGRFGERGWVPVHYHYRSLDRTELVAYYRQAEVGLVTPLKDGMNLVAKEYCAANVDEDGVLILSEFAGAAAQLQDGAILINPYDTVETADAIHRAVTMEEPERKERMQALREAVRQEDIYWWLDHFLLAATAEEIPDLPPLREYVPRASSAGR